MAKSRGAQGTLGFPAVPDGCSDAPRLSGLGLLTLERAALAHPTHSGSMPSSLAALWAFSLCQVLAGQA